MQWHRVNSSIAKGKSGVVEKYDRTAVRMKPSREVREWQGGRSAALALLGCSERKGREEEPGSSRQ